MYKVLVLGANGQLGSCIKELSQDSQDVEFIYLDYPEVDLSQRGSLSEYFQQKLEKANINLVINCAAYTQVDKAEEEETLAMQINHIATQELALICKQYNILLIHISTDYVFSGRTDRSYREDDEAEPLNVYGRSKRLGEKAILDTLQEKALILRSAWLYSIYGVNFAKKILQLAQERESLSVIDDQIGCPSYAPNLARVILKISQVALQEKSFRCSLLHYTDSSILSWNEFANLLVNEAQIDCEIKAITTEEYGALAQRPLYSALDCSKIKEIYNITNTDCVSNVAKLITELEKLNNAKI